MASCSQPVAIPARRVSLVHSVWASAHPLVRTISPPTHIGTLTDFVGIGQFNSFWAYTTPILGAIIADEYLGRFNTIFIAIAFSIVGHILLIVSAIPSVLTSGNAIGPFILGVITLGFGTGAFKANISPLIAEQYRQTKPRVIKDPKTGARVISDPNITLSRIFLYFYMVSPLQDAHPQILRC